VLPSKVDEEVILSIFSEGDFLGEMSLLDQKPRSANAVAMEESEVYVLNRTDFLSFLQKNQNAIKCILSCLSERLRRADDLLEDVSFLSVSAKLSSVDLLIIDDFGLKPLKGSQDEDFHDVIAERYERKSTIVTSNVDIPEWTDAFPNRIVGAATIDRLRYGAYKVVLDGKSYRSPRPLPKTLKTTAAKSEKNQPVKGGENP
jgi:CRP-like cAMP-binding protein